MQSYVVIAQSNESYMGEQFLRSEGEQQEQQEQEERENQTVKTKKAPLREGPNFPGCNSCWETLIPWPDTPFTANWLHWAFNISILSFSLPTGQRYNA